jgi:RNA polymerase sigma-70 factor (ECF subfamily)
MPRSAEKATRSCNRSSVPDDAPSLEQIYDRYRTKVFRRARTLLRDPDRARDAMQEVFLRAAQHQVRMSAHPLPWLFRVTKNLCLSDVRDDRRRGHLRAIHVFETVRECEADARVALKQLLARAPEELQQIAICYYIDDLSHDEIAGMFGVSRRTIGNRLATFQALADELFGIGAGQPDQGGRRSRP